MNRCEEFEVLASAAIDEELAPGERTVLFNHLAQCERCTAFFLSAINIQVASAKEGMIPMRGETPDATEYALRPQHSPVDRSIFRRAMSTRLSIPAPIAGLLAAMLVIIIIALSRPTEMVPVGHPVQLISGEQALVRLPVVRIP